MAVAVQVNQADILRKLREQLAASRPSAVGQAVQTGWPAVDEMLPERGLACGAVHEWLGVSTGGDSDWGATRRRSQRRGWTPPIGFMMHLADRATTSPSAVGLPLAVGSPSAVGSSSSASSSVVVRSARSSSMVRRIVWIGPKVWPYPIALCGGGMSLLDASLFLRVERADDRLFAALLVLRSRGAGAVVVDGSDFDLTATRRLQHAAESGAAICFLARPPWDQECLSAARTRWRVRAAPSWDRNRQRWIVELLRCKGLPPARSEAGRLWMLERDHATGDVVMAAELGHGCRAPSAAAGGIRTG